MSLKFQIRKAHKEDLEAVIALEQGTSNAPHWAESDYIRMIEVNPNHTLQRCFLVAEHEGKGQLRSLIGFAVGKIIGTGVDAIAELESIVVAKQAQRSGVGRVLCAAIIQWCHELKASNVELEVRPSNIGAIALYTNCGFAPTGLRKDYYRDPKEDAVVMKMAVSGQAENRLRGKADLRKNGG